MIMRKAHKAKVLISGKQDKKIRKETSQSSLHRHNFVKHKGPGNLKIRQDKAGNNIFGQCGKTFSTKRGVQLHIGSKHQLNPQYKCICAKGFVSNTSYKAHMDKHAGIKLKCVKCGMCNAVLFNKQALKDHTIMHCPIFFCLPEKV